jgi:hypothetical protein
MQRTAVFLVILAVACGGADAPDHSIEWRDVLERKKAAVAPGATPHQKQAYADSIAAFIDRHPTHSRAREVYRRIELDFAKELASLGRYHDAIRFYRAVLDYEPRNAEAEKGIAAAVDHLSISRAKLLALQKGMSQRDVAHLLGKPIPGWTVSKKRRDTVIDSWYYRKNDGTVAGVYFRDGELFAAEENSQSKLAPLVRTDE